MNKNKFLPLLLLIFGSFLQAEQNSWPAYKENVLRIQQSIPGWCPKERAEKLMEFVLEKKPERCVEIGSFAGSTTFPLVCTLSYLGNGTLYAIDAWDNRACVEGLEPGDPNATWWPSLNVNMEEIYQIFTGWVNDLQLRSYCSAIHLRSDEAIALFADESIDLLFLDGNIAAPGSLQDVTLYLPKVKKGGYIWLNLAHVPTKYKAVGYLMRNCEWIREESSGFECILFRKPI